MGEFATHERKSVRVVSQDGDTDRHRRSKFAFESVQSVAHVDDDMQGRVKGRHGDERRSWEGNASNPGPPDDKVLVSTTVDSSLGIESGLEFDLTQLAHTEAVAGSRCDTGSCVEPPTNRRLRIVLGPVQGTSSGTVVPHASSQDRGSSSRFRIALSRSFGTLVVNVPLMRGRSGSADSSPALD